MRRLFRKLIRREDEVNPHAPRLERLEGRPYRLIGDAWAEAPLFGFDRLADAIAKTILVTDPQLTLAVYGPWGVGKTTLLHAVDARIRSPICPVAWFDMWEYQGEKQVIAHLLHAIANVLPDDSDAAMGLRRLARSALATASLNAGVVSLSGKDLLGELDNVPEPPKLESGQLKEKVDLWRTDASRRIVVIVDNLDRCRAAVAVRLLDEIIALFGFSGVIFLIAADKDRLERAVEAEHDLDPGDGARYLEKIVQVEFRVPGFAKANVRAWIRSLVQSPLDLDADDVDLLADVAGWNPRQIKRLLNNVQMQLCVAPDDQSRDDGLVLASTLLRQHDADAWLAVTDPAALHGSLPPLKDELSRRIVRSRGGSELLGLDADAMSRFLSATESTGGQELDEGRFEKAREATGNVRNLFVDVRGVMAFAAIGAITALDEDGFSFARFAGSSAGAAIAALLAAGCSPAEVREILFATDFDRLTNPPGWSFRGQLQQDATQYLRDWINDQLALRGLETWLRDPSQDDRLRILAIEQESGQPVWLPYPELGENQPRIADAVAASMSRPGIFAPVELPAPGETQRTFADTDRVAGFSGIDVFDASAPHWPTVGICVGPGDPADRARTIEIPDPGLKPWAAHLSREELLDLYDAGRAAAHEFVRNR